ncbi:hypothetical protein [Mesorhizobium sp. INR15]|uniref:hypothetical protein n=1 Tax=Mesorhizobium sp. INR15 TaxID=2654248 RepID=UPI0018964403|nr:hypothetical protein [Mesorhizobium sp. INR15]
MCGRFTRYLNWLEIHVLYRLTLDWDKGRNDSRFNIAPSQDVPFVTAGGEGNYSLRKGR